MKFFGKRKSDNEKLNKTYEEKELNENTEENQESNLNDSKLDNKKKSNGKKLIRLSIIAIVAIAGASAVVLYNNPNNVSDLISKITNIFTNNAPNNIPNNISQNVYQTQNSVVKVKKENNTTKQTKHIVVNTNKPKNTKTQNNKTTKNIEKNKNSYENIVVPDKVIVEKAKNNKIKVIFKTKTEEEINKIKKELQKMKQVLNSKKMEKEILSKINTKILILKGNIKNQIKESIKPIKESLSDLEKSIKTIEAKENNSTATISTLETSLKNLENNFSLVNNQLNSKIETLQESLKNINKDTIIKLENLVSELNSKTKDMKKLNDQIEKIKKIFQDNIKANIKLTQEFDDLKLKVLNLEKKVNGILYTKTIANKNANNNNLSKTENLTKKDYVNTFGFFYAGYSQNDNGNPTGYISDSKGKIYEVQIGDVINNRYKIIDIKPLYLKLKDLENGKSYIISYKQ